MEVEQAPETPALRYEVEDSVFLGGDLCHWIISVENFNLLR
jgi:hypothetical protein